MLEYHTDFNKWRKEARKQENIHKYEKINTGLIVNFFYIPMENVFNIMFSSYELCGLLRYDLSIFCISKSSFIYQI